jgi:serine phosphatase RsbU (regulator of sigma subunit)/CHASE2 domain-containing sensor protein
LKRSAAVAAPGVRRPAHIRVAGAAILAALAALNWLEAPWTARLQAAWFDAYQTLSPRHVESMPSTVVAIDEKSLTALGQWPWPRTGLAQLVDAIARERPAAIAVDILMPEADALSPESVLARTLHQDPAVIGALRGLTSNDTQLARALTSAQAVLAVAGTTEPTGMPLRAPTFSVSDSTAASETTPPIALRLAQFAGVRTSMAELDRAASGRGLISVETAGGVIRRIPLVASVGGTLVPALTVEMLRVALHAPSLRLLVSGPLVQGIAIGELVVPTEDDGAARVYYSPRDARRFVSAVDVLEGRVDRTRLQQKLVLIGVTGLGLVEYQNTPIGQRMPDSEIHAQLLENIYDKTLLHRPAWAHALEEIALLVLGALLVWATPRWKPQHAALLVLGCLALPVALGFFAFRSQRLLFDAATPDQSLLFLFGALLLLTLDEQARQRKSLERLVQLQREQSARIAGELQAARHIQTATLPRADLLRDDRRIDLAASMVPAREVGGDLYDFFLLDEHRLFFLIGDVSDKGLPASIFMAVSKALYKSTTLRSQQADIGELMSAANIEVSRDNPEMMFVTAFVGILDLETGELDYCNAGHENPYLMHSTGSALGRIEDGGGPPLCSVTDFAYRGGVYRMRPDEMLCMISDGVTEAQNVRGDFYGNGRVQRVLLGLQGSEATAHAVVEALRTDVNAFTAGAEPTDDVTILVLRWRGPHAAA